MCGKVSWNGVGPPKYYKDGHVYIFDDVNLLPPPQPSKVGRVRTDPHRYACESIRDLFEGYSDYQVHSMSFRQNTRLNSVYELWEDEMKKRTEDELVFVYYHGLAGESDNEYNWHFSQYPKNVNAYEIIRIANQSSADCMFLLDCWIHTRLSKKTKWRVPQGCTLEIIAAPDRMRNNLGKVVEDDEDLTSAIVNHLLEYMDDLTEKYSRQHAMRSIPNILKLYPLYSNPIRIWLCRPQAGDERIIRRLKLSPDAMRDTRKLEFVGVLMQGPKKPKKADDDDGPDDEAYESGGDDEDNDDDNEDDSGDSSARNGGPSSGQHGSTNNGRPDDLRPGEGDETLGSTIENSLVSYNKPPNDQANSLFMD